MALPTAPLGSMSNLNAPTSVPVYDNTSLWKKALAQFLTQTAIQAGSQGVENVMSKDYAPKDAQKGVWNKIVNGPVKNRSQYEAELVRNFNAREAEAQRDFTADQNLNTMNARLTADEIQAKRDAENRVLSGNMDYNNLVQGQKFTSSENKANREATNTRDVEQNKLADARLAREIQARLDADKIRGNDPQSLAYARMMAAEAASKEMINRRMLEAEEAAKQKLTIGKQTSAAKPTDTSAPVNVQSSLDNLKNTAPGVFGTAVGNKLSRYINPNPNQPVGTPAYDPTDWVSPTSDMGPIDAGSTQLANIINWLGKQHEQNWKPRSK